MEEFVRRSHERYGERYNYNKSVYIASDKPITITCYTHGDFTVARAEKHLTGQECPTCCKSNGSSFELYIATLLNKYNIKHEREKTFDDCRAPSSNRKLKYDFYLPDFNILIEFDGIQHHQPVEFFNTKYSFEKTQLHDFIKTNYAKESGLFLIRLTSSTINDMEKLVNRLSYGC
jgi:very-short-patch-repair endonuclease